MQLKKIKKSSILETFLLSRRSDRADMEKFGESSKSRHENHLQWSKCPKLQS